MCVRVPGVVLPLTACCDIGMLLVGGISVAADEATGDEVGFEKADDYIDTRTEKYP